MYKLIKFIKNIDANKVSEFFKAYAPKILALWCVAFLISAYFNTSNLPMNEIHGVKLGEEYKGEPDVSFSGKGGFPKYDMEVVVEPYTEMVQEVVLQFHFKNLFSCEGISDFLIDYYFDKFEATNFGIFGWFKDENGIAFSISSCEVDNYENHDYWGRQLVASESDVRMIEVKFSAKENLDEIILKKKKAELLNVINF